MLEAALADLGGEEHRETSRVVRLAIERTRGIVRDLRRLTFALEPITLRDHGFGAAFGELAAQTGDAHSVEVTVEAEIVDELERPVQVCLYRIAQEALANDVKHANATHVSVRAHRRRDGSIEFAVADDGSGTSPEELDRRGHHQGVDAMRERASGIGATLRFEPTPGGGTTVRLVVPPAVGLRYRPLPEALRARSQPRRPAAAHEHHERGCPRRRTPRPRRPGSAATARSRARGRSAGPRRRSGLPSTARGTGRAALRPASRRQARRDTSRTTAPTSDAPERLVQERRLEGRVLRVSGRAVLQRDLEAPGQARRPAEELLVEVVPEAPERLRERRARRDAVEQDRQRDAVAARRDRERRGCRRTGRRRCRARPPRPVGCAPSDRRSASTSPSRRGTGARRPARTGRPRAQRRRRGRDRSRAVASRAGRSSTPSDAEGEQQPVPADVQRARVDEEAARGARDGGEQHGRDGICSKAHVEPDSKVPRRSERLDRPAAWGLCSFLASTPDLRRPGSRSDRFGVPDATR